MRRFFLTVTIVAFGGAAQAAEVSFTASASEQFDPVVTLPGFDVTLGELTSATLEYALSYINSVSLSFTCDADAGCTEDWPLTATASISAFGDVVGSGIGSAAFACNLDPGQTCFAGSSISVNVAGSVALDILDVLGVASFDVSAATPAPTVPGGIPDFFDIFPSAELTTTVTYTFDEDSLPPVPLPASALLLMAALGGLGLARRGWP